MLKKVKLVRRSHGYEYSYKSESNCITFIKKRFDANLCSKQNRENPLSEFFFNIL